MLSLVGNLTKMKAVWEPTDSVPLKTAACDRKEEYDRKKARFLPTIPPVSKTKRAISPPVDEADRVARVARKKRQRVLERHKKLVERLRASGVGMKQILTILGITNR